jgi:hypothetical protein
VESKATLYRPQFYVPYSDYPGKILAIPGNHDSNPQEDPKSIDVFQENFCAPPPTTAPTLPGRRPMYQPGVYFRLDAPFVQIIALFSNGGELEGVLRGPGVGNEQWNFLQDQLKEIKAARDAGSRRALVVAVHHPPFSGGGGHSGSAQMLKDLDLAFGDAEIAPDAVISGHAHVYERFTRDVPIGNKIMPVPYIVAGNGGHNVQPIKPGKDRKPVRTPLPGIDANGREADHTLEQYFNGFGHLYITVTDQILTIDLIGTHTRTSDPVDSVTVRLASDFADNEITHETSPFDHPADGEVERHHVSRRRFGAVVE